MFSGKHIRFIYWVIFFCLVFGPAVLVYYDIVIPII